MQMLTRLSSQSCRTGADMETAIIEELKEFCVRFEAEIYFFLIAKLSEPLSGLCFCWHNLLKQPLEGLLKKNSSSSR